MDAMLRGAALALALICAAAMGFATQRGATCTVAAVDEWVTTRRLSRFLAILEASMWVSGGLLIAREFGAPFALPPAQTLTGWTLIGAALLGLGALVNGACVFGAIARLGSGEWAYAATPLGFFLGCVSVNAVFAGASPTTSLEGASHLLDAPPWVAWLFAFFAAVRVVIALRARGGATLGEALVGRPWSPHAATIVIGVAYLALLLLAGAWAYTDVLAELARGMADGVNVRLLLVVALLIGAVFGGWLSGRLRRVAPAPLALGRAFAGGMLMAWGSLLIPGSNDGLVLLGMPLFLPYAWAAFATMCLVIAAGLRVTQWHKTAGDRQVRRGS
jgi:toxin CptA